VNSYLAKDVLPDNRHIVLIEDDKALAEIIKAQLSMFAWNVSSFSSAKEARTALANPRPAAVIVHVNPADGSMAGGFEVPHLVISSRNDWDARLAAVRSGAAAYLVKPIDIPSLVEVLDRITTPSIPEPVRVLILDDDELLARHYALIFETAGMNPMTINHPSQVLDAMAEHQPEIVLLDLYMPECTGIDVMRVIRQKPRYESVPIVFLSSETSLDHQQLAMQTGAEEFLQKSMSDAHLVNAVTVRAMRFRSLASLIREDSLTGLLNHVAFKLRLETEVTRSRRADEPLSLAMLDIDHFKRVNDIHGHPQGDRVLKSLSQLLRTRLRKSDIIGRYGGEEFVVAMPNTPPSLAGKILDELRAGFGTLQFESPHGQFACTFSAGVAATTLMEGPASLIIAADNALYHAKRSGRDRVELYEPQASPHT
jgi:diguanylate cyclase (GGDEF)-like protein